MSETKERVEIPVRLLATDVGMNEEGFAKLAAQFERADAAERGALECMLLTMLSLEWKRQDERGK